MPAWKWKKRTTTAAATLLLGTGLVLAGPATTAQAATCSYTYSDESYVYAGHYSGMTAVPSKTVVTSSGAEAQCLLKEIGYSITVDGVFGPKSQAALRDVQSKLNKAPFWAGITVDGMPGPETWPHLRFYAYYY
ncbi:peptidoglycan-binding protein [Streptomyces sp. FIT100]|uniref:peptidoglycan-binding domain-containing protein n=1 Tax=Streptomyces sp. FIT100 TaxID=2837956 RepID=UPI0021C628FE|nr:peptidoglycan-binding domain-containing protein [Streptomyces sp. FIT100]UUN26595.1 peptidoglycan-binding protein [Streptomyces sp. FIT100]